MSITSTAEDKVSELRTGEEKGILDRIIVVKAWGRCTSCQYVQRTDEMRCHTVAEELVLSSIPDYDQRTAPSILVLSFPGCSPNLSPVALDGIQRWQQAEFDEGSRQPAIRTVMQLDHPYGGGS